MKLPKISLENSTEIRDKISLLETSLSEYSFANLYLFRKEHEYSIHHHDELFINGINNGLMYNMPLFSLQDTKLSYIKEYITSFGPIYPIDEKDIALFDTKDFEISTNEKDWDYIYDIEKLKTYPGKKLQKKRNLLKQFIKSYTYKALPLTENLLPEAQKILDIWLSEVSLPKEETDYVACKEAIALYEDLILCGGIYYADDEPAGFIIGEELHDSMFVLHFAKGLRKFKGIYQYIYSSFAHIMPEKYCCFNFEQDLGNEGLKQAKSSYYPDRMLKKYLINIK